MHPSCTPAQLWLRLPEQSVARFLGWEPHAAVFSWSPSQIAMPALSRCLAGWGPGGSVPSSLCPACPQGSEGHRRCHTVAVGWVTKLELWSQVLSPAQPARRSHGSPWAHSRAPLPWLWPPAHAASPCDQGSAVALGTGAGRCQGLWHCPFLAAGPFQALGAACSSC